MGDFPFDKGVPASDWNYNVLNFIFYQSLDILTPKLLLHPRNRDHCALMHFRVKILSLKNWRWNANMGQVLQNVGNLTKEL